MWRPCSALKSRQLQQRRNHGQEKKTAAAKPDVGASRESVELPPKGNAAEVHWSANEGPVEPSSPKAPRTIGATASPKRTPAQEKASSTRRDARKATSLKANAHPAATTPEEPPAELEIRKRKANAESQRRAALEPRNGSALAGARHANDDRTD